MGQNKSIFALLSVLSIAFISMGVGILTPAIQDIAVAFPGVPFTTIMLVSTLPSLTMIPASLIIGAVAEKWGYRMVIATGVILFTVGGTLPFIQNSFTMILVSRGIFGLGLGVIFPMANALVLKLYDGQERANIMGICGISANIGGIALQMAGAFLCAMSWRYTFLAHLVGVLSLVLVLAFLPEPEKQAMPQPGQKVKLHPVVWTLSILCFFVQMLNYPMLLNMSSLIIKSNLGTAASAGIVLSMFTVGGMIGGAVFGKVFKVAGRFTIGIGVVLVGVGLGIINFAGSIAMLSIGTAFVGVAFFLILPGAMMDIGRKVEPAAIAMASGIFMAVVNLGGFVSPYYMAILTKVTGNTDIRFPLVVGMVGAIAMGVMTIIARLRPEPMPDEMPS